jgi:membrane-associated phospholipid phosphatase
MWSVISNLGDAAMTLPIALACAIWLVMTDRPLALRWLLLLASGMMTVGVTKIAYAGCGFGIPQLEFRVISGHTMLSTAVWTVTIALIFISRNLSGTTGAIAGLAVGVLTAAARVFDEAHTVPEVVAGWLLRAAVAVFFVRAVRRAKVKPFYPRIAATGLLLVSTLTYGRHAPIQELIDVQSPVLCTRVMQALTSAK